MQSSPRYKIFFISDSAATIDFGNIIDEEINKKVLTIFHHLQQFPLLGMTEAIPAYSSVSVYFDVLFLRKKIPSQIKVYEWINDELHKLVRTDQPTPAAEKNIIRIPACYDDEFAIDISWISEQKSISKENIIHLHHSKQYRVFMLGFLPGFAYMGQVDEAIEIPRKPQPQLIPAGSVGIAGRQTGIYPFYSPGGWQIIGRTPLQMFDKNKKQCCLLSAGDYIEFYPITKDEFESYQGGSV
ncbi:MAG TPA: 5-oxoprolinase subunit PxpB [Chitinophagaceae bacterium]|jgi:inhibitor of KinA